MRPQSHRGGNLSGWAFRRRIYRHPFTDVPDLCSNTLIVTDGDAELAERERAPATATRFCARFSKPDTGARSCSRLWTPRPSKKRFAPELERLFAFRSAGLSTAGDSRPSQWKRASAFFLMGVFAASLMEVSGIAVPQRYWNRITSHRWRSAMPSVCTDRSLFLAVGRNPADFDTVVVKSPHCQPHMFEEGAQLLINVDAPGSTSANLKSLGHTRCVRPIFPLDDNVTFISKAKIFRREL